MALARKFSAKFGGKTPRYVDCVITKAMGEFQVLFLYFLFLFLLFYLFIYLFIYFNFLIF